MTYLSRGPGISGIDSKWRAAGRRIEYVSIDISGTEAPLVRHSARGPNLLGIAGKSSATGRRIAKPSTISDSNEAPLVTYLSRGPDISGIDSKWHAAGRRIVYVSIAISGNEAPLVRHPARGPIFNGDRRQADCGRAATPRSSRCNVRPEAPGVSGSYPTPATVEALGTRKPQPKSLIHKPFATLALLCVTLCLAGCPATAEKSARANERWYDTVVEPLQSEPERALRFYDRIIRLKGADLVHELEAARQGYEKEKTELGRVELAMILSLPGTPFRDERAAANLLQPYVKDRSLEQSPLRPLALLLNSQLAEARKLDDSLQQQAAKAKDEQKKADDLQQKLDALLEMEKKMLEREQTIPTNKK